MNRNRLVIVLSIVAVVVAAAWLLRAPSAPTHGAGGVPTLEVVALLPLTGPGASLGDFLNNGITLAKEEIGRKFAGQMNVHVEVLDSKNLPGEAVSVLRAQLSRGRPHAVISGLSSVSSAIKPIVESEGILTIATATAREDILHDAAHIVRVYPTAINFVSPVVDQLATRFARVAIIYVHDDFGAGNYEVFRSLAATRGLTIVAAESYELLQSDTRSLVVKIAGAKPQAVYVVGYGPAYTRLFTQFKEQAPEVALFADIAFPNPAVLSSLGDAAEGIVFNGTDAELSEPKTAEAAAFRKSYRDRFAKDSFMVAGFAYDSLMMLAKVAMKSGTFVAPTKAALVALSPIDGIMGTIHLNASGECDIPLHPMIRDHGTTVGYTGPLTGGTFK